MAAKFPARIPADKLALTAPEEVKKHHHLWNLFIFDAEFNYCAAFDSEANMEICFVQGALPPPPEFYVVSKADLTNGSGKISHYYRNGERVSAN